MPLLPTTLTDAILRLTDPSNGGFVGFPTVIVDGVLDVAATNQQTAQNWAQAAATYYSTISVPVVLPSAIALGQTAFASAMAPLIGAPGQVPPTAVIALGAGFQAFVAAIAAGLTLPGVAVPPAGQPPIVPGPPVPDPAPAAATLAATIDAWTRTGTFTPPGGSPIPWS